MKLHLLTACLFLGVAAHAGGAVSAGVTFTRDVAPVLYKRCVECDRPGEVAGVAFTSYKPYKYFRVPTNFTEDLPEGARIDCVAHFDNSANDPSRK